MGPGRRPDVREGDTDPEITMTTDGLDPDAIDAGFVPRFREDVVELPMDDELVLFDESSGQLHQLDRIATVICSFIDGRTPLAAAIEELGTVFDAERDAIATDVVALVQRLGRLGLLEGVVGDPATADDVV
jgi:hypothetical protein